MYRSSSIVLILLTLLTPVASLGSTCISAARTYGQSTVYNQLVSEGQTPLSLRVREVEYLGQKKNIQTLNVNLSAGSDGQIRHFEVLVEAQANKKGECKIKGVLDSNELYRRVLSKNFQLPSHRKVKVAFFDADATLRVAPSGKPTANGPKDVAILPFVADTIAKLSENGYLVAVVSNQKGVSLGYTSISNADAALNYTRELIRQANPKAIIHHIDFATHGDKTERKPNTGMAERLERTLKDRFGTDVKIDKKASFMVGDASGEDYAFSSSDRRFAENFGIQFVEPSDFFSTDTPTQATWRTLGYDIIDEYEVLQAFCDETPWYCPIAQD